MNNTALHIILSQANDFCYRYYSKHPDFTAIRDHKICDLTIQEVVNVLSDKKLLTTEVKNAINWHFGKKPEQ